MSDLSAFRSHKDLDVWKMAMALAERLYRETKAFPRDEIYGMTSQIRRAAVSIAANIAEGFGRNQTTQFLRISQGSAQELDTHLMLSERLRYLAPGISEDLQGECRRISQMIAGLMRSLENKAKRDDPRRF